MLQSTIKNINLKLRNSSPALLNSYVKFSTISSRHKYDDIPVPNCTFLGLSKERKSTGNRYNLNNIPFEILSRGFKDEAASIPTAKTEETNIVDDYRKHEDTLREKEFDCDKNSSDVVELNKYLNEPQQTDTPEEDFEHSHKPKLNGNDFEIFENDYDASEIMLDKRQQSLATDETGTGNIDYKIKRALEKLSPEEKLKILDIVNDNTVENLNVQSININGKSKQNFTDFTSPDLAQMMEDTSKSLTLENFESKISLLLTAIAKIELKHLKDVSKLNSTGLLCSKASSLCTEMNSTKLMLLLQLFYNLRYYDERNLSLLFKMLGFQINSIQLKDMISLDYLLKCRSWKKLLIKSSKNLHIKNILLFERKVNPVELEDVKYSHLFLLLKICVRNKLNCTYMVIDEINRRGIIRSVDNGSQFIGIVALLPSKKHSLKFMIPRENEIVLEMLTKECLSLMASRIDDFSVDALMSVIARITEAVIKGNDFFYHEGFLAAAVKKTLSEDWPLKSLRYLAHSLFRMHYVADDLLATLIKRIHEEGKLELRSSFLPAIGLMNEVPTEAIEFFKRKHELPTTRDVLELFDAKLPIHLINDVILFLSIGYINEKYCEAVLHESFIDRILSLSYHKKRRILLIDFVLRTKYPSLSHCCLSESVRKGLFCLAKSLKTSEESKEYFCQSLDFIDDIIKDSNQLVSQVTYKDQLFISKLLVVDEEGWPVQLLDQPQTSNEDFLAYEDLNINPNHKRIVFLHIPKEFVFAPDRKIGAVFKLTANTMESEGFHVIKCFEDQQNCDVEHSLLCMGVKLTT